MNGEERREKIINILKSSDMPISGINLARRFQVSRQVIVQDIALIRAKDVFVYHKVYGVIKADMNIHSRRDIKEYLDEIKSGKSSLLKNVTSGYHYHTVAADDEKTLNLIQDSLYQLGFLAKLQEYEPVDFWSNE